MRDWSRLRPWLVVGLVGWLGVGVLLVERANRQGLVESLNLSPYHLVGYAGLATLAAYVAWRLIVGWRGGGWRTAFPRFYGGLGLGFGLLLAWLVGDLLWQATLGIGFGFENAIAPPRLLIPLALIVIAAGPVREALATRPRRSLVAAAVVALGLAGASISLTALNPIREPLNDYAANQGIDHSEIWLMAADGSSQRRLLPALGDGTDYSLPAWSPDGSRLAFTTWTNRAGLRQNWQHREQTAAIWTMAADGTDLRLVADGAPNQAWIPAWSPDGAWIAYTVSPTGSATGVAAEPQPNVAPGAVGPATALADARTWLVRPDGSDARELDADAPEIVSAVWSPDGSRMAYIHGAGGESDVFVATFRAGTLVGERAVAPSPAIDWGPAWSPDGQRLAFTSDRSGNDEVWVVGADGSGLTQLTDDGAGDWAPSWAPDGSRLVFVSDRGGDSDVWSMTADGGDVRNLSRDPSAFDGQWSAAFAPDGSQIAYARASLQPERASGYARWELMAAENLLFGLVLAVLALLVVALGPPIGAFTVVLTLMTAMAALPTDEWRFIPAAIVAGAAVDVGLRLVRPAERRRAAAAAFPALAILAIGLTIGLGDALVWSLTMLLGVVMAAGLLGWGLAAVVESTGARGTTGVGRATGA